MAANYPGIDMDTRLGFLYMYTLPLILLYAGWTTESLVRVYRARLESRRSLQFGLAVGLVVISWSPVLFTATRFYLH